MSHITVGSTVYKSLDDLTMAAVRLGGKLIKGQTHYRWYNRFVGDTPMPEGMTIDQLGKCDHAITFPGCEYDVGVRKQNDGTFRLVWDYYYSGGLNNVMGDQNGGKFAQAYGIVAASRAAQRKGYKVKERQLDNDEIELEIMVR